MNDRRYFTHQLRVRYQETDQMGVVYHANYLNWFEIGRTEWIRQLGMPYMKLEEAGLLLPVTEVQVKYIQPARYDDLVEIEVRLTEGTHIKVGFEYAIRRAEDNILLVTGTSRHVWVNGSWKPTRLDRAHPELYSLIMDQIEIGEEE